MADYIALFLIRAFQVFTVITIIGIWCYTLFSPEYYAEHFAPYINKGNVNDE
jgi:hypothetical protein